MHTNILKWKFLPPVRVLKWVFLNKETEGIGPAVYNWGVKGNGPFSFPLPLWDWPTELAVNGQVAQALGSEDEGLNLRCAIARWVVLGAQLLNIFALRFPAPKWRQYCPLQRTWYSWRSAGFWVSESSPCNPSAATYLKCTLGELA